MKRLVAAFDFDGTLTLGDTLLRFMRHTLGRRRLLVALFLTAPWLALYALRLYPNYRAKQRLFARCFAGYTTIAFEKAALRFAESYAPRLLRPEAISTLQHLQEQGATIYIVSASMEAWVRPFLKQIPNLTFLTTQPEIIKGHLTGRFVGANCYGAEKVRRLLAAAPDREAYKLLAFGDSRGDRELLALADESYYRCFSLKK